MSETEGQREIYRLRAALERSERKVAAAEEALDHRQRQIDAMRRTADALFSQLSPDAMLRETIALAIHVLRADGGSVMLHDAEEDVLVFRHVVGPAAEKLIGMKLDLNKGVGGRVFRTGIPARVDNVHENADHNAIDKVTGYTVNSLMSAPLKRSTGHCLGVINVVNARHNFDDRDLEVLEVLGTVAAAAIENVHLAQEARKANIVNLIGDISHDVKNMLTPIQTGILTLQPMLSDMLADLDSLRSNCPDEEEWGYRIEQTLLTIREDYEWILEGAYDAADKVQTRVKEIADAVKGEISPPQFEVAQVNEIARQVAQLLRSVAGKSRVQLLIELDEELPEAEFDGKQLYNALYNLVNNAIPETPPGGSVTLRTRSENETLLIEVADTGRGIPQPVLAKLFTDDAISTKPGGTGLGTKIVGDIVRRHNGTIEVRSEIGNGTCFSICLPLRQPTTGEAI